MKKPTNHDIWATGIDICYLWVPGHCGIQGKEKADLEAPNAANSNDTPILNRYTY